MDGTPGLITGLAGAAAGVVSAWINRGAGATAAELKTAVGELKTKVLDAEAKLVTLAADVAKLAHLPAQVQAELEAARQKYERLAGSARRQSMSSQQTLPNFEELARQLGVEELARRIKDLEQERDEARRENLALQKDVAKLQAMVEVLLGGNLGIGVKIK